MYDARARKNLLKTYSILLGVTTVLWLLSKPDLSIIFRFPLLSLTQITALIAVTFVCLNLLLSARFKFFEDLFGGLDKVYKQHRLTGELAFIFMLTHPTMLLINLFPKSLFIYVLDLSEVSYNLGKLALLGFSTIIILTLFVRLPYHIWRRIHQLIIIPMVFLALHVLVIQSDVSYFLPLRLWILGLLFTGIVVYIYKVILYKFLGPRLEYQITSVNPRGQITEILLKPKGQPLYFEPGQFVFAVFDSNMVGPEEHPFSISSSPEKETVRLSIKKDGDFTTALPAVKKGEIVKLYGPYGQFGKRMLSTGKTVLMIAGGIGITPFLSMVNYVRDKDLKINYKLIYSFKNDQDSVYKEELINVCGERLIIHNSGKQGHLSADIVNQKTGRVTDKLILLCGPRRMMTDLTNQFLSMGIKRQNIVFEDFDLKG